MKADFVMKFNLPVDQTEAASVRNDNKPHLGGMKIFGDA